MRNLKRIFVLTVSLLLVSLSVISSSAYIVNEENVVSFEQKDEITLNKRDLSKKGIEIADTGATSFTPRLTAPSKKSKYYYSDKNIFYKYDYGMPNCTCYAYGRAYELLGTAPNLSSASAYMWYDYNKENKYYKYGKTPKLGAIACWVYKSGVSGHVAVVEKISNKTITMSNSAWGGDLFYTTTAPIDDPSNGNDYWVFQGYIYIGDFEEESSSTNSTEETSETEETKGDVYRITSDSGVNLREKAGTSYKKLAAIPCAETVTVTKIKTTGGYTWGYTTYKNVSGWFVLDYAQLVYTNENITKDTKEESKEAEPKEETRKKVVGDADGDGILTISDATRIQQVLAQIKKATKEVLELGDYDGDSNLTVLDAVKIQVKLSKK